MLGLTISNELRHIIPHDAAIDVWFLSEILLLSGGVRVRILLVNEDVLLTKVLIAEYLADRSTILLTLVVVKHLLVSINAVPVVWSLVMRRRHLDLNVVIIIVVVMEVVVVDYGLGRHRLPCRWLHALDLVLQLM